MPFYLLVLPTMKYHSLTVCPLQILSHEMQLHASGGTTTEPAVLGLMIKCKSVGGESTLPCGFSCRRTCLASASLALCLPVFWSRGGGGVIVVLDGELPVAVVVLPSGVGFHLCLGCLSPVLTHLAAADDCTRYEEDGDAQRDSDHDGETVTKLYFGWRRVMRPHPDTLAAKVL